MKPENGAVKLAGGRNRVLMATMVITRSGNPKNIVTIFLAVEGRTLGKRARGGMTPTVTSNNGAM